MSSTRDQCLEYLYQRIVSNGRGVHACDRCGNEDYTYQCAGQRWCLACLRANMAKKGLPMSDRVTIREATIGRPVWSWFRNRWIAGRVASQGRKYASIRPLESNSPITRSVDLLRFRNPALKGADMPKEAL